jgi:hypothetical protein
MNQLELTLDSEEKAVQRFEEYSNLITKIQKTLHYDYIFASGTLKSKLTTQSEKVTYNQKIKTVQKLLPIIENHYNATKDAKINQRPYSILNY